VLAAVEGAPSRLRVVHFACHGIVDPVRARGSGLLLAGGDVLDVDRLARTRMPADLVVLSACESARGRVAQGEGVYGLPRAFLLAGVPRVIASQWTLSDQATRPFMVRFHDGYLGQRLSAAAALRAAKLGPHVRRSAAHPPPGPLRALGPRRLTEVSGHFGWRSPRMAPVPGLLPCRSLAPRAPAPRCLAPSARAEEPAPPPPAAPPAPAPAPAAPLLADPGFAEWTQDGAPVRWTLEEGARLGDGPASSVTRGAEGGVRLAGDGATRRWSLVKQEVSLREGSTYRLSFEARAIGVKLEPGQNDNG
jgi:hypothetical protein